MKKSELRQIIREEVKNILESPDEVDAERVHLHWHGDAVVFGKYGNHMMVGRNETHDRLGFKYYPTKNIGREDMTWHGRCWPTRKIISFWDCPPPQKINTFLRELNKAISSAEINIKVDKNWYMDVLNEKDIRTSETGKTLLKLDSYIQGKNFYGTIYPTWVDSSKVDKRYKYISK